MQEACWSVLSNDAAARFKVAVICRAWVFGLCPFAPASKWRFKGNSGHWCDPESGDQLPIWNSNCSCLLQGGLSLGYIWMYIYFWIYLEQYLLILPAGRFVLLVLFLDLTSETHWILVYIGWDFILDIYIEIFWWECNKMRWYWLDLIKHWYLFDQTFGHVGRDFLDFLIC